MHRSQCPPPGHRLRQFRSHQIASGSWCRRRTTCRRYKYYAVNHFFCLKFRSIESVFLLFFVVYRDVLLASWPAEGPTEPDHRLRRPGLLWWIPHIVGGLLQQRGRLQFADWSRGRSQQPRFFWQYGSTHGCGLQQTGTYTTLLP